MEHSPSSHLQILQSLACRLLSMQQQRNLLVQSNGRQQSEEVGDEAWRVSSHSMSPKVVPKAGACCKRVRHIYVYKQNTYRTYIYIYTYAYNRLIMHVSVTSILKVITFQTKKLAKLPKSWGWAGGVFGGRGDRPPTNGSF